MSNPSKYNIGKLMAPNVFINTDLMIAIVKIMNLRQKNIYNYHKNPLLPITKDYISWVFDLEWDCEHRIDVHSLKEEYFRLENIYKR